MKNSDFFRNIFVIGAGYVGLSLSLVLGSRRKVFVIDNDEEKLESLRNQLSPINDPMIEDYLKKKSRNLQFLSSYKNLINHSDLIILALPTNFEESNNSFDTSILENAIKDINALDKDVTLLIKSTVPIGFTGYVKSKFSKIDVIFSNP